MVKLTESIVCGRTKSGTIENVRKLNCWGCDLDDVSILGQMPNLEVLSLSVNKINTLQPLSSCVRLRELYMRSNCINDLNEILHLQQLNELRILWLTENPCADIPNYRSFVLQTLPRLTTLDDRPVTPEEVASARNQITPPDSPPIVTPAVGNLTVPSTPPNNFSFRFDQLPSVGMHRQNGNGYFVQQSASPIVDHSAQMEKKIRHEESFYQNLSYEAAQRNADTPEASNCSSYHSHYQRPIRENINENVLSAIVLLLDELDDRGLSIVIREADKRLRRN